MRQLLLLRHAKAVPANERGDHGRDLVARGRREAARIGAFIATAGLIPDLALHSGAARTRQTLEAVAARWPNAVETRTEPGLYEASGAALLRIVGALPDAAANVMLVGHNPTIADLANALAGAGDRSELTLMAASFPTASLAAIAFKVERWRDVAPGAGTLVRFVTPDDARL